MATNLDRIAKAQQRKAQTERIAAAKAQAARILATGKCPMCQTALVRNLALTGWWQCGAFGEPGFRKPEHKDLAHCSFQMFTE